jgi:hypothetical protein
VNKQEFSVSSWRSNQSPTNLIKAVGMKIRSEIHKLTISIWNKEKLPEEW